MAKGEWPKSYVVPSVVLSLAAVGLLVWHVIDPGHVDAWAVTLLVVAFLPWLRPIFETIAFPGGGSIKFRELEAKQERQQDEIDAMRFLVANFLPAEQKRVLRKFADDGPYDFAAKGEDPSKVIIAMNELGQAGLLGPNPDLTPEQAQEISTTGSTSNNLKIMYGITELGREYLKHLDKTSEAK